MSVFGLVPGLRLEALQDNWVVFSPVSGDTLLLNTEAASVLELLSDRPMSEVDICQVLATDTTTPVEDISATLQSLWPQLLTAGVVRELPPPADNAA